MKVKDLVEYLEAKAPLKLQEDYDNSGLLIGSVEDEVTGALLCLDVTDEVLAEAIERKCNLIIAHHPVIFRGLKKLNGSNLVERVVVRAIRERVAIYAIHTNLDNSFNGLNALLLHKLGVKNPRILLPQSDRLSKLVTFVPMVHAEAVRSALFEAGAGHIGKYDCCSYNLEGTGTFRASEDANPFVGEKMQFHEETEVRIETIFPNYLSGKLINTLLKVHPYEEVAYDIYPLENKFYGAGAGMIGELEEDTAITVVLDRIKSVCGIPFIRHTAANGQELVRKVALCTGSGSFLIHEAVNAGADLYLTSDLKYHDFFEPDGKLILADIGHYESEQLVKEWIYHALIEKFPTFAILISETNTNPVKYY